MSWEIAVLQFLASLGYASFYFAVIACAFAFAVELCCQIHKHEISFQTVKERIWN